MTAPVAYVDCIARRPPPAFASRKGPLSSSNVWNQVKALLTTTVRFIADAFALACQRSDPPSELSYRPQTNGKAERFIQTLIREWAYVRAYRSSAERGRAWRPSFATTITDVHMPESAAPPPISRLGWPHGGTTS
jgi:transposase InsO family protein